MRLRTYLWIVPFLAFILGYFLADRFASIAPITAPSLIGLDIHQACVILGKAQLHPRLLEEIIDPDLPSGTIINQIPAACIPVKPGQTVSLVVSRQPALLQTPTYIGKDERVVEQQASTSAIRLKSHRIPSSYPKSTCIGQWPSPGTVLEEPKMIVYYASAQEVSVLVPDTRGSYVQEVLDLCQLHSLPTPIIRTQDGAASSGKDIVVDQRPAPGSLLEPSKIAFHLLVTPSTELPLPS